MLAGMSELIAERPGPIASSNGADRDRFVRWGSTAVDILMVESRPLDRGELRARTKCKAIPVGLGMYRLVEPPPGFLGIEIGDAVNTFIASDGRQWEIFHALGQPAGAPLAAT